MASPADPRSISPKVVAPSLTIALSTVISAIITGDWSNSETAGAIASLVVAVVGYFTRDPARDY